MDPMVVTNCTGRLDVFWYSHDHCLAMYSCIAALIISFIGLGLLLLEKPSRA
jgi:hypothetical protein